MPRGNGFDLEPTKRQQGLQPVRFPPWRKDRPSLDKAALLCGYARFADAALRGSQCSQKPLEAGPVQSSCPRPLLACQHRRQATPVLVGKPGAHIGDATRRPLGKRVKLYSAVAKSHTQSAEFAAPLGAPTLASASFDETIKLWNTVTGKERATLRGLTLRLYNQWPCFLAYSPDGKTLASGSRIAEARAKGSP
jgi:hypothetical protein